MADEPSPPKKPKLGHSGNTGSFTCDLCKLTLTTKWNLERHVNNASCVQKGEPLPNIPDSVVEDELGSSIVDLLDYNLQFAACQKMGVFKKRFYPICFPKSSDNALSKLTDFLAVGMESIEILTAAIRASKDRNYFVVVLSAICAKVIFVCSLQVVEQMK